MPVNLINPESLLEKQRSNLLKKQEGINEQQERDFFSTVTQNRMPGFDPNYVSKTLPGIVDETSGFLNRYNQTPFDENLTPEARAVAGRLGGINQALRKAQLTQQAQGIDFSRGLRRRQLAGSAGLEMSRMLSGLNSAIAGRKGASRIAEIGRDFQVNRINTEYKNRLEQLRKQAEAARQRGDSAGWAAALSAIGTIAGALIGGPLGATAGGSLGGAIGSQI